MAFVENTVNNLAADFEKSAAKGHNFVKSLITKIIQTMTTLTDADKIKLYFPKHTKRMLKLFVLIINCIVQSRTVCLYKCRDKVPGALGKKHKAKANSNYMRIIRFFKMKLIAEFIDGIHHLILNIVEIEPTYLIMDRSNWKIGSKNVNILTIGGLLEGAFIPLHWLQLNKRGNSNYDERIDLLDYLIELFHLFGKSVEGLILLADREFIGAEWLKYLSFQKLSFVIRLRENMYAQLQTVNGKKNSHLNH